MGNEYLMRCTGQRVVWSVEVFAKRRLEARSIHVIRLSHHHIIIIIISAAAAAVESVFTDFTVSAELE